MFSNVNAPRKKNISLGGWVLIFTLLVAILLVLGPTLYPVAPVQPTATAQTSSAENQGGTSFLPEYDATQGTTLGMSPADQRPFWQVSLDVGLKLLLVIGLLYLTLAGLRRLQKAKGGPAGGSATIQVLETVGLAPGRTLHLVVVGEKTLLVGSTDHTISLLANLAETTAPLTDALADVAPTAVAEPLTYTPPPLPSFEQTPAYRVDFSAAAPIAPPPPPPQPKFDLEPDEEPRPDFSLPVPRNSFSAAVDWQIALDNMQSGVQHIRQMLERRKK